MRKYRVRGKPVRRELLAHQMYFNAINGHKSRWEREYTDEESAWLLAVSRLRGKLGRVPSDVDGFRLAHGLGYRKG